MRLLYRDADILIFDEPTSVLTPQEADELFTVVRNLATQGKTIIFITHKLREVFALAERVTVMRRGRVVTSVEAGDTDAQRLASLIVGENFERVRIAARKSGSGKAVLQVEGLGVCDDLGNLVVGDASFAIRAGEIVGIAGIEGSGQRELVEALVGLRRPVAGQIIVEGNAVNRSSVWTRRKGGFAYISEDRDAEGSCLAASLADNVFSTNRDDPGLAHAWRLDRDAIGKLAK